MSSRLRRNRRIEEAQHRIDPRAPTRFGGASIEPDLERKLSIKRHHSSHDYLIVPPNRRRHYRQAREDIWKPKPERHDEETTEGCTAKASKFHFRLRPILRIDEWP